MSERALVKRLSVVRRRARVVALVAGLCLTWLTLVSACALTLFIDRVAGLSEIGRLLALAACLVAGALGLALGVFRVFLRPLDDDEAALLIEEHFGRLRSLLISAVQLTRAPPQGDGTSLALIAATERQAVEALVRLDVGRAVPTRRLKRFAIAAAAAFVLAAPYTALRPAVVGAWALRLLQPFNRDVAYPTRTRLSPVTGHIAVPAGEYAVVAVAAEGFVPGAGRLVYRRGDGEAGVLAVRCDTDDRRTFRMRLGPVAADTWYWFEIGDAFSPRFLITALPRPELTGLVIKKHLPPYVRLPDPDPDTLRDVEALEGTRIHLEGETSVPPGGDLLRASPTRTVHRATLVLASGLERPMTVNPDGSGRISGSFLLCRDDSYRIDLAYDEPRPDGQGVITVVNDRPIWYRVSALPDRPPQIEVVEPDRSANASPVGQVMLKVRISDDYGVERASLWYAVERAAEVPGAEPAPPTSTGEGEEEGSGALSSDPAAPAVLDRAQFIAVPLAGRFGSRRVAIDYDWLIQTTGAVAGDRIVYYLTAVDGRQAVPDDRQPGDRPSPAASDDTVAGPNVTESEWREIAVVSIEEIERQLRERREAIQAEIYRIYRRQKDLRARVDDLRMGTPTSRPTTAPDGE